MNTSIAIVSLALSNEALTLPAAKNKKFDTLKSYVYETADELFVKYHNVPQTDVTEEIDYDNEENEIDDD